MNEALVWSYFSRNWVFKLYSKNRSHYVLIAIAISVVPWIIGVIGSLLSRALITYIINWSPYLNTLGFLAAMIAFGWYANKICYVINNLFPAFHIEENEYKEIIRKWADRIANKNWLFALISLPLVIINVNDVIAIWSSATPPIILEPWVSSHASLFFAIFYGLLHAVITPFLLGSGILGLIGTMLIIGNILSHPLNLAYYRRTEVLVELVTWLVMWTLIGLASVLIFGRPIVIFKANIAALELSGIIQSTILSLLTLAIGAIPLVQIMNSVSQAKRIELSRLEHLYDQVYSKIVHHVEEPDKIFYRVPPVPPRKDQVTESAGLANLYEEFETVEGLIKKVESIPNLPIKWNSILRVVFGVVLSASSSFLKSVVNDKVKFIKMFQ